jgi:hypothetical protein
MDFSGGLCRRGAAAGIGSQAVASVLDGCHQTDSVGDGCIHCVLCDFRRFALVELHAVTALPGVKLVPYRLAYASRYAAPPPPESIPDMPVVLFEPILSILTVVGSITVLTGSLYASS